MGWGAFSVSFNGLVSLSAIPSEPVSCDEGKLQIIFVTVSLLLHSECSEILIQSSVGCYMIVLELLFIMNWIHYYFFREQLSLLLMNQHRLLIYTVAFLTWVHSPQKNNLCSRRWKKQIIFICTVCLWYENYFTFSLSLLFIPMQWISFFVWKKYLFYYFTALFYISEREILNVTHLVTSSKKLLYILYIALIFTSHVTTDWITSDTHRS